MSARHVLLGHMKQFPRSWKLSLIVPASGWQNEWSNSGWNVMAASASTQSIWGRYRWERNELPHMATKMQVDVLFSPNGINFKKFPIPQATLAQNPWCLTPVLHEGLGNRTRALLQRCAYRSTQLGSQAIAYNSRFMQNIYRQNAGGQIEQRGAIVYQGINAERFQSAERKRASKRQELTIVSVSAMARWKGADRLVRVLRELHQRGVRARLRLVGPWPDANYRRKVESVIKETRLEDWVYIAGRVSDEQLDVELATAKVYVLLSECESFGIPAVEAQAFGTPVVGGDSTAMPEIGGDGGLFVGPHDIKAASDAVERLLTSDDDWRSYANAALANAERFRWAHCSPPLVELLAGLV